MDLNKSLVSLKNTLINPKEIIVKQKSKASLLRGLLYFSIPLLILPVIFFAGSATKEIGENPGI